MEKNKILFIIFLISAIICFCLVGYGYWGYRNLFGLLEYYGAPKSIAYENEGFRTTLYQLYWGMGKYAFLGILSLAVSVYFLIKSKK